MFTSIILLILSQLFFFFGAKRPVASKTIIVANQVEDSCLPIAYSHQQLQGKFGKWLDFNLNVGLMSTVDYDDYLQPYRDGSFEAKWPTGEFLGKYIQALTKMYPYTNNPNIMSQLQEVIQVWGRTKKPDGFLGTHSSWERDLNYWDGIWQVWEHKYILLGLLDFYSITEEQGALDLAMQIGDLLLRDFPLNGCNDDDPDTRCIVETGAWGMGSASILEPMTYLYRYTGDSKYLKFCEYILDALEDPGPRIVSILTQGSGRVYGIIDNNNDWNNGRKGYEMISCIIGMIRMYQLTGRLELLRTAEQAWKDIHTKRLYITGTSTTHETFEDDYDLPGGQNDEVGEGCVTAHWIFLNRLLFYLTGEIQYIDEIEKSIYNHLMASKNPFNAWQSYFVPLQGNREWNALHNIWSGPPPCCLSSVMRCIARLPEAMWTRFRDDGMAVLIYNQGAMKETIKTASGSKVSIELEVQSDYPETGNITILVNPATASLFRLGLRVPSWTTNFQATVNKEIYMGLPGRYLDISRVWSPGDTLNIRMDISISLLNGGPSYSGYFAVKRGPQVLALDSELSSGDLDNVQINPSSDFQLIPVPEHLPNDWMGSQAYMSSNLQAETGTIAVLVPFSDAGQYGDFSHQYRTWIKANQEVNRKPIAVAAAQPTSGPIPLVVQFIGSSSFDPDGDPISFVWHFGNGDSSILADPQYTYNRLDDFEAKLIVRDDKGAEDYKTIQISIENTPPTAKIISPLDSTVCIPGQHFEMVGVGYDSEDDPEVLQREWIVDLHREDLVEPEWIRTTGDSASFIPVTYDSSSLNVFYVIKFIVNDSRGLTDTAKVTVFQDIDTLVDEPPVLNIPEKFKLREAYPNPFNPSATIEYFVAEPTTVSIKIYDLLGKEVAVLVDDFKQKGDHKVVFDARNLASGIYLYRGEANGVVKSRKMILLK